MNKMIFHDYNQSDRTRAKQILKRCRIEYDTHIIKISNRPYKVSNVQVSHLKECLEILQSRVTFYKIDSTFKNNEQIKFIKQMIRELSNG